MTWRCKKHPASFVPLFKWMKRRDPGCSPWKTQKDLSKKTKNKHYQTVWHQLWGHPHRSPAYLTLHQWKEANGDGNIEKAWFNQNQADTNLYWRINYWKRRERESRESENKSNIYEIFFVHVCKRRWNRNNFDDAIFLFAWSHASHVFQIVIPRVSVEPDRKSVV